MLCASVNAVIVFSSIQRPSHDQQQPEHEQQVVGAEQDVPDAQDEVVPATPQRVCAGPISIQGARGARSPSTCGRPASRRAPARR